MLSANPPQRTTLAATALLVAGMVVVGVLAGIAGAINDASFNARYGDPTMMYHFRVASVAAVEFLLLAIPGIFLAMRGHRSTALIPALILSIGRVVAGFEHGFGLAIALIWLALAVGPAFVLIRSLHAREHVHLPPTLWTLAAIAAAGLLIWYIEVIFSPDGRLTGAPAGYLAFLAFGLLLGAPRGWLAAHGILLGLAVTANGIAYGWLDVDVPIAINRWSLATLIGPVVAGVVGSAVHRATLVEAKPTVIGHRESVAPR